jgi:hypothetical protein
MLDGGLTWARESLDRSGGYLELPTGHWPMFSRLDDLAALLLSLPSDELA